MEFRPTCVVPCCGGLGIYRCEQCHRIFCSQHAEVSSETSADGAEGPWRVRCHTCQSRPPSAPMSWDEPATEGSEQAHEIALEQSQQIRRHPQ
jgi:hypothetical protein